MSRCVVLLSGGVDSTVLMYGLVSKHEVWPLSIDYGQRHVRELEAARDVCEARGGELLSRLRCIDLSNLSGLIKSALHGHADIPDGPYNADNVDVCVSPNRNMIFLAVAAGYAQSISAVHVAYAAHANDATVYPDCRPEFVQNVGETMCLGTGGKVSLLAPFVDWDKAMIVRFGRGLNVPFVKTWSCYKGGNVHCGVCPTCLDRKEAFKGAGIDDPTEYVAEVLPEEVLSAAWMRNQW